MNRHKLKIGYIVDPLETFDREAETTFFIMAESSRRGHENWAIELQDLFLEGSRVFANARQIRVEQKKGLFSFEVLEKKRIKLGSTIHDPRLPAEAPRAKEGSTPARRSSQSEGGIHHPQSSIHCLFLRKDPPVDLEYINHLTLLAMVEESPTCAPTHQRTNALFPLFINSPRGIRRANEKIYPLSFPGISPPTVVSRSPDVLAGFLQDHKKVIVKPLNGAGGKGIFILRDSDPDGLSLLEIASKNFAETIMLQKHLAKAAFGDKRVLVWDGEPLGAFLRIPSKKDFRGNMHRGARWVRSRITAHEKKILGRLAPRLRSDGLIFVGVDFIGDFITEINVTSPMGIREINHLYHLKTEKKILDEVDFWHGRRHRHVH